MSKKNIKINLKPTTPGNLLVNMWYYFFPAMSMHM